MIIFVGDKPSKKNIDPNIPFVGTQSYKRLLEWIWKMDIDISDVFLVNKDQVVKDFPDIEDCIALGNEASKTLTKLRINHFKLPHPSGANYQINDNVFIDKRLDLCRDFLKESK